MATNNDDIKWLYGKLKAKGYNIGTEQEFQNSLANEEDRKWYYEKAKGIGLNFGDMDDFDSLYAPQPIQSSTAQQQPAQKKDVPGSTTVQQTSQVAAGGTPMPEASVTEQPAMKPAWEIGENNSDSQRDNSDLLESHDGFGGGTDAFYGSEAHKRMQHYREVIKKRKREDEAKREEEMANRVAEMEFLKDATDFYTRMAEESKARETARKEGNDEYVRMMKEQEQRNAEGRRNADLERSRGIEWDDPDYRRELDAIEPEYSSTAKEYSSAALEEASGLRPQHGVESTPEEKESAGEIDGSALEGEALASRQHRGMMSEEEARQLSTEAYDGKTILAYDKDRKGVDPVTGKGGYIDRTRYPAKARVMNEPEDIWSVSGKVDRTFTSDEPGGLPELSVTGISKAALKRRYEEYLRLHPELGDVAENSDKSRELMGSLRSEMIDEGRAVDEAFETWKVENPHKVRDMSEEELAGKREEIRADSEFVRRMGNLDLERDYIFRRYGERTAELTAALRDEFESKGLKPDGNQWLYALDAALRGDEELKALNVQSYNLGKAAERYEDWVADGRQGSIVNFAQGVGGAVKDALLNPFGLVETQGSMIPLMHIKRKLARERRVGTDVKGGEEKDAKAGDGAESSLSQDEVLALESYFLNQETQGRTKMSLARNSGEFTGALAEMAAEFGLNPASGLAKRTLARIVAEVGKDGAMSLIRISSRLARMVGYKGVEVSGARVAANLGKVTAAALGEGAVMSATTQGLKNFNAAAGRTIAEPVYDDDGNLVDVNGEGAGSAVVKTGVSSALTNAAFVFPVTFGAKVMKGFDNMAKTMHVPFGNPVDALVKMKSGEAMSILTADAVGRGDMDPTWGDFADPEKNGELIMGLLAAELTSGAMRGTANVANGVRLRHSREMAKAEMMAKAMRGAEAFNGPAGSGNRLGDWVAIVKAVYEGEESTIVDALARVARDGSMTSEQKEAALDYARSAYRYIGADRAYEEWRTRGEREAAAREAEDDWNVVSEDTREMWEDESYTRGYEAARSAFTKYKPEEGRQNKNGAGTSGTTPRETEGKTPQETAGETSGQGSEHNEETPLAGQDGASSSGKDAAGLGADASGVDEVIREMNDAYRKIEDVFEADSEYYRAELEENPWGVLENPEITQDQQEVVLDFINAKAAMNGMMDASGDVLEMKRKEIERSVEMRTHKKGNVIIPVVKNTGEEVYLVKGHVAMTPDGKGVDKSDSDLIVYLYNPISGKYESSAPEFIERVGEPISPEEELETAMSVIEQEQMSLFGNNAVASDESVEGAKPQQAPEALATANTEAYDRGYEQGISSTNYTDEELSRAIETGRSYLNEGSLDDFGRGRLEGLEYEQQRRAMEAQSVPEMPENVPNSTENAVSEGEIVPEAVSTGLQNESALSRIPRDEAGNPVYEQTDPATAWEGLTESVGGDEASASELANAMVGNLERKLAVLQKRKLKGQTPAELTRELRERNNAVSAVTQELEHWRAIADMPRKKAEELTGNENPIGRSLSDREATDLIAGMEANAGVAPEIELTIENWDAQFGEDGMVGTPIGDVKMGENQFTKLMRQGRNSKLGMIKPTLEQPDIIVEDISHAKEGKVTERGSSYVFVKTFVKPDGSRYYYFTSVTVSKEGHEVIISNQEKRKSVLTNLLMKGKLVWKHADNVSTASDVEQGLFSSQGKLSDPASEGTVAPQTKKSSDGKDNALLSDKQAIGGESSETERKAQEAWKSQRQLIDRKLRKTADVVRDCPEAVEILENTSPQNIWEAASWVLSVNKLIPRNDGVLKGFREMTGYKSVEQRKLVGLFAKAENGGKTLEKLAEDAMQSICEEHGIPYDNASALNALLDVLQSCGTVGEIRNYIENNRIDQAMAYYERWRRESEWTSEEEAEYEDYQFRQEYGVSREEYENEYALWNEYMEEHLKEIDADFDVNEFYGNIADESAADRLLTNNGYGNRQRKIAPAGDRGDGEIQVYGSAAEGTLSGRGGDVLPAQASVHAQGARADGEGSRVYEENGDGGAVPSSAVSYESSRGDVLGTSGLRPQYGVAPTEGAANEPTEAQKAAGNYKMEHRRVDGFNVSIENVKGSLRRGTGADGKPWETAMQNDYGYIRGTEGVDGDHIDVFLSDTPEEGDVFVVDQVNEDGSFDEHKVMYGFPTEQAARDAYLSNYEQGWTGLGAITHVSKEEFKKWIQSSKRKTKPFAKYKRVKPKDDNSMVGRSLSEQEATDLIAGMEANAKVASAIELTPENWIAQFGEDGTIETPIGIVKMGANQLLKLYSLKRTEYFGMIHPTLNSPDVIIEKNAPADGAERESKYLFVKTFIKPDGSRLVHFESVTVQRDGMEVSISSHEVEGKAIKKEMQNGKILHLSESLSPSSERYLTETPNKSEGPDLVPTSDNVSSDGKDNTLLSDKQAIEGESFESYTITPAVYVGKSRGGKPGKETPMHRVTFNRPLTAEQERVIKAFANEAIGEKKGRFATKRGWADREAADGSWLFRTEEDARKAGEMIANEEAVADAQPMTAEELREAVGASGTRNLKLKKEPINRVSLEDVMTDLSTKGETKLSDHAEPVKAEPEAQHEISDDEMQSLLGDIRDILGIGEDEGDTNIKFRDPGELTSQERMKLQSAGIRVAMALVERGTISFPDYATKMVGMLGDKIRPWLKSFYEGARWTPGYEKYAFTPTEQVATFDVQNFDKKQSDPFAQAAMIVEERKASTASEQAEKELIETRNKNRRENDKQREADTAALAEKAEAVAGEAESIAETSADAGELNRASELIDQTLDEVNDQLAVLGYYEAVEDDSKFHESYGYMLAAEKKAVADAAKLAKQLVNDLGINIKVTSATTPLDRKSVKKGTAVRANIAPAGGDVIINLPLNEGRELAIYIGLDPVAEKGTRRRGDNLAVERILYRLENPNGSGMERCGHNWYAPVESTYADFLRRVKEITRDYLPSSTPAEEPQAEAYHGTVTLKDGREAVVIAANHVQNIGETPRLTDYIVGVKGEPGTIKISQEEIAHAGAPTHEDKPTIPAKSEQSFPDVKDTEAVSKWLDENSEAIWKGVDAITKDAIADTSLRNTFKTSNDDSIKESDLADFVERWLADRLVDMMAKHPATVKAWYDYGQRGLILSVMAGRIEDAIAKEVKNDKKNETINGYKRGDEVMWDRSGNGKWEKQVIKDFDEHGNPILDSFGTNWISEVGDWSRVKPADGIFGEAQRVARATQEKKRSSRKKDVTLKPEQPVGDLFGGLFDNTQNSSNHEETEMGTRSGEAGGQRQQLKQDTQVGGDEPRRETERPAGEAGSGSTGMDSDADRAGSRGLHDVATQPALERLPAKERKNVHNNHVERGTEVAPKSESARIKANIAAIETMKKLEASGEAPTAADMKKLRAFSGWGGLGKAFSDWDTSRQLRQLLGDKLYDEGAEMSRNSAYFTPAYIVDAMWDIARAMGFKGGRVLEGSAGIGNVLGLMPQDLSERSYIRAVEKDPTTGKMLSLLYPDAVVDIDGFEKVKIETGTYDLVITNVPFVPGLKVADTSGDGDISKEFKTSIHDFCIAKNVRKLRDGGVGVFITTAGSMDGTGRLHKWLSNRENADIVGMFRMHNETFGGTNATSDIIVVRKRVNGVKSPNAIDCSLTTGVRTAEYDTGEKKKVKNVGEVPIIKTLSMSYNRYYVEHPEYMAGEMHFGFEKGDTSFRPESKGLYPIKEKDQSQLLSQWVEDMKQKLADTSEEPAPTVMNHRDEYVPTYDKVGNEVKTGTVVVDSQGRICVNYDGTARPLMSKLDNKNPKSADERIAQFNKNKVKGRSRVQVVQDYNAIKKALNDLLEYQKASDSDEGLQSKLKALNRAFDSFVATYGHLHGNNGLAWLKNDVDYPSVIALETYREEGLEHRKVYGKADIFSRRVVVRPEQPKATNVRDGVTLSIRQTGSLDTRYIAEQLDMSEADVRREVIEAGLGYENPLTHSMEAAHEYLSGNVREKMQQAEVNNEDGRYTPNITALRKVVPHNIPSHFIEFSIGSSWLRPELFEQYVKERTGASVKLTYAGGMWAMDKPKWTGEQDKSFGIRSEICDKIITGTELIEAAMTNRTIRVSKQQKDGPTISDPKATSACAAKVDEIRDDFKSWLRSRMESVPELAKEIEETYNNIFNNSAPMTIPDEYIPEYFDGAARVIGGKPIKMREHQAKAVVRGTMQSLMLAHEVGTGKTFTLITTAMEMRRLGTAKKPMIVVQNATLGQFVASAKALYPDARILSLEDRDRNAEGRKDFYAKIRYNDWDMVVIPQSVLERIPDHPDRERRYIEESIQEKMDVIEAMSKDREAGRAVAALKKDVENLRDQLNKLSDTETAEGEVTERIMVTSGSKPKKDGKRAAIAKENAKTRAEEMLNRATDDTLNFDDLGVDAILVDEAHEYKHLGFATAMQRGVKGVDPSYSKKCQGLYLKVKAVQEKSGGRNVIFATGTPISNTAAEVWTFMRYLLPREVMEGHNIWHFDDFVRNFGSIQQMLEFTTQGTYKENNRFAGYSNLPELARIWAGIADTVLTAEAGEVKSQIPELEGGQPTDLYLPQTNGLRAVLKFVRAQLKAYEEMSGQEKKENSHIPLVMYGIAKAAAIDARLVMANAPDDPHSKTNETVRQVLRSLKDSKTYNGTVAIFADNYQRKNKGTGAVEFNLFDDIRTKLIAQGVPAEQVVIMRDGMTDKAKEKIFAKVNAGEIRVILGTTQRLGVGVNIQERLHTLMHIDAPNRPMDYWQRMGRLLRQGNMHKEMGIPVRVIRFGVEDSLDVTAYQRLKTKGAIADAIMHSKDLLANNLENRILEEEGDEFGNITAELSGSQYAMLQNQTEKELRKLQAKQDQHRQHQMYIHRAEPRLRELIEQFSGNIVRSDEILALLENNPTTITINGKTYHSREDMQKVFEAHNKAMAAKKQSVQQDEPITSTLTFDIGNVHFTLTTHVSQTAGYGGQGALSFDVDVQHDVVSHDIDYKRSFGDIPLKRIINELVDNVTSGKEERSNREAWVNAKERNETDLAALLKDKGKPFEHGERIKELEQKLEEYTIAMQEELREKEAKYAEMDANIEDATDITFTSEDDEDSADAPTNGEGNKYRLVEDSAVLDFLDGQPLKLGYRYSQWANMGVLPPMTAKQNGEWRAPMVFSRWEQSEEGMRKENGKADLVQGNGRTTGNVAYNPYFHIRTSPLNDQFTAAYDRPELIVVEGYYPESEETSGYHAEGAKDSVGLMDWHSGSVNGQLSEDTKVQTMLSRYFKPGRIVPWSEVADLIMKRVGNQKITFPINAVPPMLRAELAKRGARFGDISGSVAEADIPMLNELRDRVNAGEWDAGLEKAREYMDAYESSPEAKEARVANLSAVSHTPVRIIRTQAEVDALPTRRERRAKDWWSAKDNEVVIVLPNNVNVADVDNTFVHEVVGHKGLRAIIGEERFDEFLGEVYNHASDPIRKVIDKKTDDMVNAEADRLRVRKAQARERAGEDVNSSYYADMAGARLEAEAKRDSFRKEATEEYMADMAGRIGNDGFEKMSREELTLWGKIKAKIQKFLDRFLQGLGIAKSIRLTDKDLSYILYKSWKNLRDKQGKGGVFAEAEDAVMRMRTGWDDANEAKQIGRSEAALKHLEPSSTDEYATKISKTIETAKKRLHEVSEQYRGVTNTRGFLTDLGDALGLIRNANSSGYRTFELKDGRTMVVRISNHNANSANSDGRPVVSIVLKSKRSGNTFVAAEGRTVDEYVYMKEDIRNVPGNTLSMIADSVAELLDTGIYTDRTGLAHENHSPEDSGGLRVRDGDLGLEEYITKMKAEALQANTDNLQAKRDAMRAIGGNLNHLRQAMARQREYDITTVKSVADLARILMDANLLDDLSKYETKRILGAINNVVGKQDVSRYVQKVMDIMVDNQLRMGANTLGRLLSIRGSHVDARGIEVQGELDPDGQRIAQVVRKSTSLPKDDIDNRIAEAINRMSSKDKAIADDATIEYAGLQIARQYVEDITESKAEEKELRDSIKQAKEDKDAGQMTEAAYKQYVEATNDAIRQNKIDRAEAFHSLVEQVGDVMSGSIERAKAWREAEKQRVEEIHHNANSDMECRPTDEHHKDDRTQKLANNSGVRFLLAPLATFDQMLRMFGKKNVKGEGYLWNRYMRGWVSATEKEYTSYRDALKVLDAKVGEIYGKDMKWGDLFSIDRKLPKASVRFFDGGEMKDHELTQGNLLYIYMADKMSDGRMKLRRMGITEENIEDIKSFLDPKFIQLADWMQEEFLVDKRNEYNEVHKRMFGASMTAIENYFPLKILSNARLENVDVADDTTDTALPATSTGSIIKRRRNNLALDVTGANAFSVILDHLQQMERWAAFAEFNRDLNTLLSYKRFRNQVMNMSSVYGGGKTLWNNFRNVCSMAAGAYRPPIAALDKSAVNIAKGVTAAKVSFRVFTALKQFLSMPAYISDSTPMYLAANIANPIGAWRWSMKNLPLFEKRWSSRMAGDPRLLKSDMDWKMWRSRIVEIASRVGMSPNAFVDALTVAIGSHSMYQTKLAKYKRQGYDPDVAEARAKQDATILFNQTQQSSEGAFLSTMQVDRSWLSVLFTVFRNSSMSYTRQLYDSIRNLGRRFTPGYKGLSEEFMAKQMRRDGIDPDRADRNAKQEYRRGIIRDMVRVGVFGYIMQLAWNLGAYLPYLILGEDDEEKDKMWQDVWNHSMFGSIEGLTGGDVISAAGNMWVSGEGNPQYLTKDMPLASDVLSILKKMDKDQVAAMNDVINLLVQSAIGVNPQSLTDAVVAVMDYCGDDAQTSRECALLIARVINCPPSQLDKVYFDELDATGEEAGQMTPNEIAERYARYKVRRGAPFTGWAYGNVQREKLMDKYRDRSNTLAKERLTRETDNHASQNMAQWLEEFEATKDRVKEIRKVKSRDEDRYYELLDDLEVSPEYERYEIIRDYKRDINALTKEWLRAKTPTQLDSCAKAIIGRKREMVSELVNTQQ